MNQLVRLTTNDLNKAETITDSWIIAENLQRKHDSITKAIKKYESHIAEFGEVRLTIEQVEGTRSRSIYELNEGQATFIMTLMDNSEKVIQFKKQLVKAFLFMKHELTVRGETRLIGKTVRKDMTKAIVENVPDNGNFKKFAISNYTKLVYKKVLGMNISKWKEINGLHKEAKIRDYLTKEELEKVQALESSIASIIEFSSSTENEKELYGKIKQYVDKQ
jgi:phage regulator Rha-like protein